MQLKHFYISLDESDFYISDKVPYEVDSIVADFNFQTDYFTHFVEMAMRKLKFDADEFNMIIIRPRKTPAKLYYIENAYKAITIEVDFEEDKHRSIYPHKNTYPLGDKLLKPLSQEDKFHQFLFKLTMEALNKAYVQDAPIPSKDLEEIVLSFREKKFINEWVFKKKQFKKNGITASLQCQLTINYFALNLLIEKENKKNFNSEIFRSLPNSIIYKDEFKDIVIESNILKVIKNSNSSEVLYKISLDKINS